MYTVWLYTSFWWFFESCFSLFPRICLRLSHIKAAVPGKAGSWQTRGQPGQLPSRICSKTCASTQIFFWGRGATWAQRYWKARIQILGKWHHCLRRWVRGTVRRILSSSLWHGSCLVSLAPETSQVSHRLVSQVLKFRVAGWISIVNTAITNFACDKDEKKRSAVCEFVKTLQPFESFKCCNRAWYVRRVSKESRWRPIDPLKPSTTTSTSTSTSTSTTTATTTSSSSSCFFFFFFPFIYFGLKHHPSWCKHLMGFCHNEVELYTHNEVMTKITQQLVKAHVSPLQASPENLRVKSGLGPGIGCPTRRSAFDCSFPRRVMITSISSTGSFLHSWCLLIKGFLAA